ncbi:hypothetical protein GGX14DRAFT_618566 [Mycena pura]|uniref:Heterokaryon incompatibility domain-containing protein n=1 Tax=Mycena pura TaxID=153505 RepID=A0AAD6YDF0_9AGAR|nr:hypothetical protein GGX14DRAFT_618566 [Mycena pura]
MPKMFSLAASLNAIGSNLQVRRLFYEDDGVEGCGLFHKRPEQDFHIFWNILRLIFSLLLAPFTFLTPHQLIQSVGNYLQSNWLLEYATTPDAVLFSAKGGGHGQYDVTGFKPSWVLKATILNGTLHAVEQVPHSEEVEQAGYTALSYPMLSAAVLADEANFVRTPPPPGRDYTPADRRAIAAYFLRLYCATGRSDANPHRTEYIWLDEFCLSDDSVQNNLSRRSGASNLGALRTSSAARRRPWSSRLFTIAEILHAQRVLRLTRQRVGDEIGAYIRPMSGRDFRKAMQLNAAKNHKWHLYAIFQHTVNAGAVPWQVAIHALVVEAIRRDEAGGFLEHKYLGKGLNGLLPRRARLQDLGNGGWADLSWLLELNQGFYNAASLAAVCSVAVRGRRFGNERLEPVATAFPVSASETKMDPVLAIIGGQTLGLRHKGLKRDPWGLLMLIISTSVLGSGSVRTGIALYWLASILYCILELLVGTMYLDRNGWVFLEDEVWGHKLELKLGEQDNISKTAGLSFGSLVLNVTSLVLKKDLGPALSCECRLSSLELRL